MSVYPKVYLALLKRMLQTAANFFFFNMCMLLFLSIPCKTGWLLSVNVLWLFHLSLCVVSLPAVQLDLTNLLSRNSPALGIDHIVLHSKFADENY